MSDWLQGIMDLVGGDTPANENDNGGFSTGLGALAQAFSGQDGEAAALPSANENDNGGYSTGLGGGPAPLPGQDAGPLSQIMKGLGLQDKNGKTDLSNPDTLNRIMKLVSMGGGIANSLMNQGATRGYQSPASLQAALSSPFTKWNPQQQADANKYFGSSNAGMRALSAPGSLPSPVVAGKRYAEGGDVEGDAQMHVSSGALSSLVKGPGGGQDDKVPAWLGPGEYVMDADIVSALGDGSNEHGAKKLDEWRERIRTHKRGASAKSIPPKAKTPEAYLNQVKAK